MKMILLPILLMSMLATMMAVKPIAAQGTTVSLSPTPVTGNVGDEVTVDVMVTDVLDLYGYEFKVVVQDPNVAMVWSIDVGDFFPAIPGYKVWKNDVGDFTFGWLAVTRPLSSVSGVSGSGKLATIHLLVLGTGGTYLQFALSVLGNPFGDAIAHTAVGGYFSSVVPTVFHADIIQAGSANRPSDRNLKFPTDGTTETLLGTVVNNGTVPIYVRVRFEVYDEAGLPPPGGAIYYSDTVIVAAGALQAFTVVVQIDSTMVGHRYHVTNYVEFDHTGTGLLSQGTTTWSYSFKVRTP